MRTPPPAGLLRCLNSLQGAPERRRCPRGLAGAGALVHLQEQEPPRWGGLGSTWGRGHSDSSPGILRTHGSELGADVVPDMPTEIGLSEPAWRLLEALAVSTQTSAGTLQNHKVRDKLELMLALGVRGRVRG